MYRKEAVAADIGDIGKIADAAGREKIRRVDPSGIFKQAPGRTGGAKTYGGRDRTG